MAATVVSVVIFLCGVLVGRGVRAQIGGAGDPTPINSVAETTPTQPAVPAPAPAAGSDPTAAAPPPAADELSYFNRLEKQSAPAEQLKPAPDRNAAPAERPAPAAAAPPKPAPVKEAASRAPGPDPLPAARRPVRSSSPDPGGQGLAWRTGARTVAGEGAAMASGSA